LVNYGFNAEEFHKFKLSSREECERFDILLESHSKNIPLNCFPMTIHLNLADVYSKFIESGKYEENNFGRILFSWVFDIKLSYFFLELDNLEVAALHNKVNQYIEHLEHPATSLDIPAFFPAHMSFQKILTSYTLRYRAIWDKIMILLVMYYTKETKKPLKGDSKIKSFEKVASGISEIPEDFIAGVSVLVRAFNELYRTSEAHGSGVFRNWTFVTLPRAQKSPTDLLMLFHGGLNYTIMRISRAILHDEDLPTIAHPSNMPEKDKTKYFWVLREELKKLEK